MSSNGRILHNYGTILKRETDIGTVYVKFWVIESCVWVCVTATNSNIRDYFYHHIDISGATTLGSCPPSTPLIRLKAWQPLICHFCRLENVLYMES